MDGHRLLDDPSVLDQFPDLLMGVGIGDITGVQSDLLFATVENPGGKPLLKPECIMAEAAVAEGKPPLLVLVTVDRLMP